MEILLNNIAVKHTGILIHEREPVTILEPAGNYVITSPSGTGKSTLIHILFGLIRDYEGLYFLNKQDTKKYSTNEWANLRKNYLSIVFQGFRLIENKSAYENIQIKNKLTNYLSDNNISDYAKQLGVYTLLSNHINELSFGQQQRVAILRSLCQPFKWLLLDEPFAHLDTQNVQKALTLILNIPKKNTGIIISDTKTNPQLTDFSTIKLNANVE